MTKARDGVEDLKTIDANFAAKAPLASPVFTGNVGIGVTPEAWHSSYTAIQVGGNGTVWGSTAQSAGGGFYNSQNVYYDGGYKYISTDTASKYAQSSGTHKFKVAPSGTADAAISWTTAMTIDNAGIVITPSQPSFRVASGTSHGGNAIHTHSTQHHNVGNNYNSSNGKFTAPVAGSYYFGVQLISLNATTSNEQNIDILKNGTPVCDSRFAGYTSSSGHLKTVIMLSAGDYVQVRNANANTSTYASNYHNQFMGYLIG